jgi:hypothetical protein
MWLWTISPTDPLRHLFFLGRLDLLADFLWEAWEGSHPNN